MMMMAMEMAMVTTVPQWAVSHLIYSNDMMALRLPFNGQQQGSSSVLLARTICP